MSEIILINENKSSELISMLCKNISNERSYTLYLISCYFNIKSATSLIKSMLEKTNRIDKISIYIDRKEANKIGFKKLSVFLNKFNEYSNKNYKRNIEIDFSAIKSRSIFHSKAYALISGADNNEKITGSLVIGSANLTELGVSSKNGNIESLLDTQDDKKLEEFIKNLGELKLISLDEIYDFSRSTKETDDFDFIYALLNCGKFMHKWTDTLEKELVIKFTLNPDGKSANKSPELEDLGFSVDTKSISKSYFKFDYDILHLVDTKGIKKEYGIETYVGDWIPISKIPKLSTDDDYEEYKNKLFKRLNDKNNSIQKKIDFDIGRLQELGFIDNLTDRKPYCFENKIKSLNNNDRKLRRIFDKFAFFDLPYDFDRRDDVKNLFDSIIELIKSKCRKHQTMKDFLEAYENLNLSKFVSKM